MLHVDAPLFDVIKELQATKASILPTSARKIRQVGEGGDGRRVCGSTHPVLYHCVCMG